MTTRCSIAHDLGRQFNQGINGNDNSLLEWGLSSSPKQIFSALAHLLNSLRGAAKCNALFCCTEKLR